MPVSNGIDYWARCVACLAAGVAVVAYRGWTLEKSARIRAQELAAQERLRAIRAQINPHFLFNALNTVVGLNNLAVVPAAQDLVTELSDLLRQTIIASEQEEHAVAEELAYVAKYLGIEKIRHARLRSEINFDPRCHDCVIPSLILLSLVENAVTHGLRGSTGATLIEIQGACDAQSLTMTVRNSVPSPAVPDPVPHPGVGLRLMCERLNLLFGAAASLECGRTDPDLFEATLMVPLRRARSETRQETRA